MTNYYPESQVNLLREEKGCMLASSAIAKTETAIAAPTVELDTSTLLDTGGKPAAIILCLAIFIFALSKYNESLLHGSYRKGGKK